MRSMRFLYADARWALQRLGATLSRIFLLPFKKIRSRTPDRHSAITVERDVMIPMRDGVRLAANVHRPDAEGPFPTILIRLPYGKDEYYCYMPAYGRYWARKGYACVTQDVRGKWGSEGEWTPYLHEIDDGYDTIEWISQQPWCDGNVGMMGESYYSYTTWCAVLSGHPALKAMAPSTMSMDRFRGIYNDGALCLQTTPTWGITMNAQRYRNSFRLDPWHLPLISLDEDAGLPCDYYKDWIRHPTRDAFWTPRDLCNRYDEVRIPALHIGGWYDIYVWATVDDWRGVKENSGDAAAREQQWLMIGPWDHEWTSNHTGRVGRVQVGRENGVVANETIQRFFDHWLMGIDNGFADSPRVRYFTMGANEWRTADTWPPPGVEQRVLYLHSRSGAERLDGDGELSDEEPGQEPSDRYDYDPDDPVAVTLDMSMYSMIEGLGDRREAERRADVLLYTTGVLEEDLEVTGPISLVLHAASSARDTDFTATLVDVFPDGYAHLVQEGIMRASYRSGDGTREPIEPGKVYAYTIDLNQTSHVFEKGHRLRLEVSSSNFNRYDRNLNVWGTYGTGTERVVAQQTIYHDAERPSHLVIPLAAPGAAD